MGLEYKSVPFEVKEVVDLSGGGWEIAGWASTFGGTPDAYGDIVVKGAFAESLGQRKTKLLYEHQVPIGLPLELREEEHGLWGRWSIVDTQAGTDAYKLAKAGVLDSLSIGYLPVDFDYSSDGVRLLKKVDLLEVSCVAVPANTNAVITDVKRERATAHLQRHQDAGKAALDLLAAAALHEPPAPRIDLHRELLVRRLRKLGVPLDTPLETTA